VELHPSAFVLSLSAAASAAHDEDNDGNYGDERRTSSSYTREIIWMHAAGGEKIVSADAVSFLFPQVRKPAISWRRTDRQRQIIELCVAASSSWLLKTTLVISKLELEC
jgi:hypothetical protein